MANDKESCTPLKFSDSFAVHMSRNSVSIKDADTLKYHIASRVNLLADLVKKQSEVISIYHDSGKQWKKNRTDKQRFSSIQKSLDSIAKSVS